MWLALRDVPLQEVWNTITQLHLWELLCLAVLNIAIFLLLTSRWWLILRFQGHRLPLLSMAGYRIAAFAITYFTPGPQMGGEPLQIYLTRSRHGVPTSTAVAAVSLDKLLELQSNFAFLVLGVAVLLRDGLFGQHLSYAALLVVVGLLLLPAGLVLFLWRGARPIAGLSRLLASTFPHKNWLHRFQRGAVQAEAQVAGFCRQKPLALLAALLLSLAAWVFMGLEFWLTLSFLGLRPDLFQTITLLTAARVAFVLPVPAGAGTLEASLVLTAGALGFSPAAGVGVSLLIRARDVFFAGLGLSLSTALTRPGSIKSLPTNTADS
jgi:uncharacterized protein (TIRG00374 family)